MSSASTARARGHVSGRVSVVVPTFNSSRTIEACLASVLDQSHPDVELIVVDNFSTDATAELASAYADHVISAGPERSAQRNRGFELSTGEFICFLDSDQLLTTEVLSEGVAELLDAHVGAIVIPEVSFGEGFLASCRSLERRLNLGCLSVEAARIFRRSVLEAVGGFDEDLTGLEDWDLDDRVRTGGWRSARTRAQVRHDEGRVTLRRAWAKKRYYGRWLSAYRAKPSSATRSLSRLHWLQRAPLLARHPILSTGLVTLKAVEAVAFWFAHRPART